MLDFVNPQSAGWQRVGFGGKARLDEPAGRVRIRNMPGF
jgi:hypothetical protein